MAGAKLDFWFDFASTYSYLSAMRIGDVAERAGVEVAWRPFLLGPIFAAQGWNNSPFNIYPAKGKYMWRDMQRRAETFGLPFQRPDPNDPRMFPQHSVLAARLALIALDHGRGPEFCRAVYTAEFANGRDISSQDTLSELLTTVGLDPEATFSKATAPENKARLREQTEKAIALGVFGAPSFTVGEELFWGDDRLEDAVAWATRENA